MAEAPDISFQLFKFHSTCQAAELSIAAAPFRYNMFSKNIDILSIITYNNHIKII